MLLVMLLLILMLLVCFCSCEHFEVADCVDVVDVGVGVDLAFVHDGIVDADVKFMIMSAIVVDGVIVDSDVVGFGFGGDVDVGVVGVDVDALLLLMLMLVLTSLMMHLVFICCRC